jgi:hypothetical protein
LLGGEPLPSRPARRMNRGLSTLSYLLIPWLEILSRQREGWYLGELSETHEVGRQDARAGCASRPLSGP